MKTIKRPTFAILSLVLFCLPVAHAEPAAPSGHASAAPAPSGSAAAVPKGIPSASYAWPKETSDQPKSEEWAGATELESITTQATSGWSKKPVTCRQRALRAWVRVDCPPPEVSHDDVRPEHRFYGSLWGLAGDVSGTAGQFQLVSSVESHTKKLDEDLSEVGARLARGMGAVGTVIFQAKYGSAAMLRLDQIFWVDQYDGGGNALLAPGIVIDVSWALGEKYPSIELRG